MEGYLGEETLKITNTKYSLYTPPDWVILWIEKYGWIDGAHHKDWLLDQICRILKGTQITVKRASWGNGTQEFRFELQEPPTEYWEWVKQMKAGEDGPDTYSYDFGVAP